MSHPLRVAVIGAGAFGRNHLRVLHDLSTLEPSPLTPQQSPSTLKDSPLTPQQNLSNLEISPLIPQQNPSQLKPSSLAAEHYPAHAQLAAVVDPNPTTRDEAATRYRIPAFATVDDLLAANRDQALGLHAATVAVPTIHHAAIAAQLLEANLDVLIEKPLTATLAEADALIALAAARGRILAAGHLERFNPAVTAALPRLTRPMFFEAHRLSIFTPRSLDVDVVLDLMIHDLDILLTMAQSPVTEVRAVGLPVLSRKVDIANVRLEFATGAIANLTASRVSTEQVRKLRLFQPAQYLSLDYARQELLTINVDPTLAKALAPFPNAPHPQPSSQHEAAPSSSQPKLSPAPSSSRPKLSPSPSSSRPERSEAERSAVPPQTSAASHPHPSAGLNFEKQDLPRAEPLRLELEDFLRAVATRTPPRVTAQAARNALALALEINRSIQDYAQRAGLHSL